MFHREGRHFLVIIGIKLLLVNLAVWWLWPKAGFVHYFVLGLSCMGFLFFLQFFRNPKREIRSDPNQILAPADGKVVVIEKTTEGEYLNSERIQISIFMSPLNVHLNRNPVSGIIKYFRYHKGKYLVAWHPKSSTENERTSIVYQLNNGIQILCRQIAGMAARRIKCYLTEDQEVKQGEEFGFIKFGSRVDVFLPLESKILVHLGQKSVGGKTILAELK
jgi:phosphatidylserine decarboxylase